MSVWICSKSTTFSQYTLIHLLLSLSCYCWQIWLWQNKLLGTLIQKARIRAIQQQNQTESLLVVYLCLCAFFFFTVLLWLQTFCVSLKLLAFSSVLWLFCSVPLSSVAVWEVFVSLWCLIDCPTRDVNSHVLPGLWSNEISKAMWSGYVPGSPIQ